MQLKNKKIMPPPWLAFPEAGRYSIGWRMGCGEDYIFQFFEWFEKLSDGEKTEYKTLFPEPVTWKGWWDDDDTSQGIEYGNFYIPLWQQSGMPVYTREWLCNETAGGNKYNFCMFWKPDSSKDGSITESCLSQWWLSEFLAFDRNYCCMEQFMMEQKADLFGDEETRKQILAEQNPGQIQALGRKVQGFSQKIWDKFKYLIILNGNWCKFSQNKQLCSFLLSTGNSILVEASPYDAIWGIQLSSTTPEATNPFKWRGENLLGFALMEVRDELRRVTQNSFLCG